MATTNILSAFICTTVHALLSRGYDCRSRYFLEVTAHSAGEAGWFHIYSEEMAHWHHEV